MFNRRSRYEAEEPKKTSKVTAYCNFMAEVTLQCLKCDSRRPEKMWGYRSDQGRVLLMHTCKHCDEGA